MIALPTPVVAIDVIHQKDSADCALAAIAMYAGAPYAHVSRIAVERYGQNVHQQGLNARQISAILRSLDCPARRWPRATIPLMDFTEATGLLDLDRKRAREGHLVVLFQGVVINPADGMAWDFDTFLARGEWRVCGFWGE